MIGPERARAIADRLQEVRTAVRALFGDHYETTIDPWRKFVIAEAARRGCDVVRVAPELAREGKLNGNPMLLLAATVDVVEQQQAEARLREADRILFGGNP